jgi:hypothetical protein
MRIEGHGTGLMKLIGFHPWEHSSALQSVQDYREARLDSLIDAIHGRGHRTTADYLSTQKAPANLQ